jgi:glycosyltransferase involved in cell wall biosynthesis
MEILVATGIFPPDEGGPATYVDRISRALVHRGHGVTVVTLADDVHALGRGEPFRVVRIPRALALPVRVVHAVGSLVRHGRRADLVYANGLYPEATIASLVLRKPLAAKVVGDWVWERGRNQGAIDETFEAFQRGRHGLRLEALKRMRDLSLRRAERIIVPNRSLAETVKGWGLPSDAVHVVHNAVEPVAPARAMPLALRTRYRIATVARLVSWKGVDTLLHVLAALSADVGLVVAGSGPEHDRLRRLAAELGVQDRVCFAGRLDAEQVAGVLAQCDALVLNSGYEGLPHVLLEALQAGVPVIATRVGGVDEILGDGQGGILVPPGDRLALEAAIRAVLADPDWRRARAREGPVVAQERFGVAAMVESTENVLRTAVAAGARRPGLVRRLRTIEDAVLDPARGPFRVCFLGATRYAEPLDASQETKWRGLGTLGRLFVIGFSGRWRPRRFDEQAGAARFYALPTPPWAPLRYLVAAVGAPVLAAWLVARNGVEILVAESPYTGCLAAIAAMLAGALGRRTVVVVESHGDFEESVFLQRRVLLPRLLRGLMRWAAAFALRRAALLRAVSRSTEAQLARWAPGKPIARFAAWTDLGAFLAAGARESPRDPTILYAGVLTPLKGVHVLIEAFEGVSRALPEARLWIAGAAVNPSYARALSRRIERGGLASRAEVVGALPQADLARRMARAQVLVLPSRTEGLSRVLLEAMAAGAVVIATRVGGTPDLVEDGVTGFLVPPGDAGALESRLLWALRHPDQLHAVRRRARTAASRFFSTTGYVEAYARLFAEAQGHLVAGRPLAPQTSGDPR